MALVEFDDHNSWQQEQTINEFGLQFK